MIDITSLEFSYGNNTVLQNISMKLEEGRIYGLLGENGVGKTTLLTLLAGLKKPQKGSIVRDGMLPFDRKVAFLEDQYYLPDEVEPLDITARKFASSRGVFWPRFSMERFLTIMQEFETDPDAKLSKMSSGQLKKTYISFALATEAGYLFLDEPTNGLDIPSKSQFRSAIMKYTREDATIVISTHQVRDLENIIDPIVILDRRDVLLNATIEEISSHLFFDYGNIINPDSLFSEKVPGGFVQVYPNVTGEETKVNIEALFNAVHSHKDLVKAMFSSK